jgi:hypothetical protein
MRDVQTGRQQLDAGVDVNVVNGSATIGDGGNTASSPGLQALWLPVAERSDRYF